MDVVNHIPSPPLNAYINCLWCCEGPTPCPRLKVLPMPSLHMMINLSDAYHVYAANDDEQPFATCGESWSVGLWNAYHIMDWPRDMQLFNVSFKPGGAYPFLQLPLAELHNHIVSLDAIWGRRAAEIREQLSLAPTTPARFALLERLLLARLYEAPPGLDSGLKTIRNGVAELARTHGTLPIRTLSDHLGLSQKHLLRSLSGWSVGHRKSWRASIGSDIPSIVLTPHSLSIGRGSRINPTITMSRTSRRILKPSPVIPQPTICGCSIRYTARIPTTPVFLVSANWLNWLNIYKLSAAP